MITRILSFFIILIIAYLFFFPVRTATIHNEPFDVILPVVERGGMVEMEIHYTKYKDYKSFVSRNLVCQNGHSFELVKNVESTAPIGEYRGTVEIQLPDKINAVGKCRIQSTVRYEINILNTKYATRKSKDFVILDV